MVESLVRSAVLETRLTEPWHPRFDVTVVCGFLIAERQAGVCLTEEAR